MNTPSGSSDLVLIVGASRGLGLGLAREYAERGSRVVATVRSATPTALQGLADRSDGRVQVETVDINFPEQVAALRARLDGKSIGLLFVNAGVANGAAETIAQSSAEQFTRLMITNAWSPMRLIETFADLVPADGVIAAMSSGLGSVANNTRAGWEIYRASKAALNTMLRSFAVRGGAGRTILAVAPGWVRTDMGGPNAALEVETSVRGMVDAIAGRHGKPGAAYIDYQGNDVAW
jgi:NAD(P)-dependent dehydrogenase (short-subunit alcohol dehydrogenase family)